MNKFLGVIFAAGILVSSLIVGGCVQMPTEKQGISDMRPQITFRAEGALAHESRIFVDGLEVGMVSDFLEGHAAVRVLPGTHIVSVHSASGVLLEEKVYLGDGVSRTFIVK